MEKKNLTIDDCNWKLVEKCLSVIGLWPYQKKYNMKFILSIIIALCNSISFLIGTFYVKDINIIKSLMLWPRFAIHILLELILFKVNMNSGEILFNKVFENLITSKNSSLNAKNIGNIYNKKIRRVLYITLGFPFLAAFGLMYEPINEAFYSDKYILLMFSAWYPISFDLSPNYEIIMLIQILEIFVAVITLASINMCSGLLILHCCQLIEILCDDIKNFREKFQHRKDFIEKNTNRIVLFNCSCLKCIVNRHNNLIDFVKSINDYLHGIMVRHLLTGTIDICSVGYDTIENFHVNGTLTILGQFMFLGISCMSFFLFCWLGSELLEKNNDIRRQIYNLKWYQFSHNNKYLIIMTINRTQRPMKITAAKYFTMSLKLYKNWFMSSLEYLSVLAAVYSRS